jgi:hypothetical protein
MRHLVIFQRTISYVFEPKFFVHRNLFWNGFTSVFDPERWTKGALAGIVPRQELAALSCFWMIAVPRKMSHARVWPKRKWGRSRQPRQQEPQFLDSRVCSWQGTPADSIHRTLARKSLFFLVIGNLDESHEHSVQWCPLVEMVACFLEHELHLASPYTSPHPRPSTG